VVTVDSGVEVVAPLSSGTVVSLGPPSPDPRRKKKAIRKTATKLIMRARNRAWVGEAGWR
jgi:hypothetical protein